MKPRTNLKTQYDAFHTTYTNNTHADKVSNSRFHQSFNFDLKGKKLLDIGCGDGIDLQIFTEKGAFVYGIDPSQEFLKTARSNNPKGIFVEGVGESLPFQENTFDVVTSKWAMQTSTNIPAILSEVTRILKPGGMFIYLSKHPMRQFFEKIRDYGHGSDYYKQQIVTSNIYSGKIVLKEPSHTIGEYFNPQFCSNFEILNYFEGSDFPASEQLNDDIFPTYFIVVARKK